MLCVSRRRVRTAILGCLPAIVLAVTPVTALADTAAGSGTQSADGETFDFDAASGPDGENATGTMTYRQGSTVIQAAVTCLDVRTPPRTIALTPATAVNPVGTDHTVTATVTGSTGNRAVITGVIVAGGPEGSSTAVGKYANFVVEDNGVLGVPQIDEFGASFGDTPFCQVKIDERIFGAIGDPIGAGEITVVDTPPTGPVPGATVSFDVSGSTTTSGTCTTNALGQCSFTYRGPSEPGADLITACVENNDGSESCAEAMKAWVAVVSTVGKVTGGGQILSAAKGGVAFGFTARATASAADGRCSVVDPTVDVHVKCLDVTTLVVTATHATFAGRAEVNGVLTDYRIDVDDLAEPGRGRDTFKIITGTGYSAAGVLDAGNTQIHK